jgi:hypothetical protein
VELLWLAIVGMTSQLADGLISQSSYNDLCIDRIRGYVRRFAAIAGEDDRLRIAFDKE